MAFDEFSGTSPETQVIELRKQVRHLKAILATVLVRTAQGRPIDLDAEPFKSWIGPVPDGDYEGLLQRLLTESGGVIGKVTCPSCGAVVEDLAGVTRERCYFCGAEVDTPV